MTTENLIDEICYEYANHPESARSALEAAEEAGGGGWINGTVILKDGQVFQAGGGWLVGEVVEPYGYRDAGEVDELGHALGLDRIDTMEMLHAHCPKVWAAE